MYFNSIGVGSTPPTNRGVTVASGISNPPAKAEFSVSWVGCHWLTGTTTDTFWEVLRHLDLQFEEEHVKLPYGGFSYGKSAKYTNGVTVFWSVGRPECCIKIPGGACDLIGIDQVMSIAAAFRLNVTRFDFAWDISGFDLISSVGESFASGNVVSRAHRDSLEIRANKKGRTIYVGRRSSRRLLRFYDARGVTRVELECKELAAQKLVELLFENSASMWSSLCMGYLRDFVDFRDRSEFSSPSRCPMLWWWQSIVGSAERKALPIPREKPTADRVFSWLRRGVSSVLAAVIAGVPRAQRVSFLGKLLDEGKERWSERHELITHLVEIAHVKHESDRPNRGATARRKSRKLHRARSIQTGFSF